MGNIKKEHLEQYRNIKYSREAYVDLLVNEYMYINSIINYAISKVDILHDNSIRGYTIIVENEILYDYELIKEFLPKKYKIKITLQSL